MKKNYNRHLFRRLCIFSLNAATILLISVSCNVNKVSPIPSASAPATTTGNETINATVTPAASSASKAPTTTAVQLELTSGHYTSGTDFQPGVYDIEALSGAGNVYSSNAYSGGINAMMGAGKNVDKQFYQQTYNNVRLDSGTVLTLTGVKVRISSDAAENTPLSPRKQSITDTVDLKSGNYLAGKDFPAGTYDVSATAGNGNVSTDKDIFSGGINAVMGTSANELYEKQYKNISLDDGVTLTVTGVEIKLTPSK